MKHSKLMITIGCIALAVQPIFSREALTTDFFDGIPAAFTLEDRDGNILSEDVKQYGFEQGDAWVAYFIESEKNMVAASTSWYAAGGTSDDRMTMPTWRVEEGDIIRWRARSADKYLPNAYKLVAECEGKETVLFTSDGEASEWILRRVSLEGFEGKEVRLSFVDCSTDASLLYVDDIRLGAAHTVRAELAVPAHVTASQPFDITGVLVTDMAEAVEGRVSVRTWVGDEEQVLDLGRLTVQPGASVSFTMPTKATAGPPMQFLPLRYEVSIDGAKVSEGEKMLQPVVNYAVCEELTGTWCAWCVRGIAAFESLCSLYPDSFIGIAIHNGDVMAEGVKDYENMIYSYGHATGYPFAFMMRNSMYGYDFDKYEDVVAQINALPVTAFVETAVGEPSGNSYPLSTGVTLTADMVDDRYQLAYVLVENDVFDPTNPTKYIQHNAFADGTNGPCGGYEDKPEVILDMHFEHVARAYVGDYKGIFASLPMYMKHDSRYVSDNTLELPASVLVPDKCEVVTLLIDKKSANIVAADKVPLIGGRMSLDNVSQPGSIAINGNILSVPEGSSQVIVADISGRVLFTASGDATVDISGFDKGMYVVSVNTSRGVLSRTFAR